MSDISFPVNDATPHTAALDIRDKDGRATSATDVPSWTASDAGATVTLAVAADGLSALVTPVAVGSSTITVTTSGLTATAVATVSQAAPGAPATLEIVWH